MKFIDKIFGKINHLSKIDKIDNSLRELNLNDPVKVRLFKSDYFMFMYKIQFYNPLLNKWCSLPDKSHSYSLWSFQKEGEVSIYRHEGYYEVNIKDINLKDIINKFTTLNDIYIYFDKINENYNNRQLMIKEDKGNGEIIEIQ